LGESQSRIASFKADMAMALATSPAAACPDPNLCAHKPSHSDNQRPNPRITYSFSERIDHRLNIRMHLPLDQFRQELERAE